jgi:hypothetical protein
MTWGFAPDVSTILLKTHAIESDDRSPGPLEPLIIDRGNRSALAHEEHTFSVGCHRRFADFGGPQDDYGVRCRPRYDPLRP